MGDEFAQEREWNHQQSLDWHLLDDSLHAGVQRLVRDLNRRLSRRCRPCIERDCEPAGFEWIDGADDAHSVLAFIRRARRSRRLRRRGLQFHAGRPRTTTASACPRAACTCELLNSDSALYGGSNVGNMGRIQAEPVPWHGRPYSREPRLCRR